MPVYVGVSLEAGDAVPRGQRLRLDELECAAALYIGLDSLVGPLYLAFGHTLNGKSSLYLFWGRRR